MGTHEEIDLKQIMYIMDHCQSWTVDILDREIQKLSPFNLDFFINHTLGNIDIFDAYMR